MFLHLIICQKKIFIIFVLPNLNRFIKLFTYKIQMRTRIILYILFSLLIFSTFPSHAGPGDTIHVQTFTFGSPQDAWFVFPSDTVRIEKIIMNYKLKCNPAQSPACGEWDYLTYTYLYQHTGMMDSTLLSVPSYVVDGSSPDSLKFMRQPSWKYSPHFNTHIVFTDTLTFDSAAIGSGSIVSPFPFNTLNPASKTQYLWKASELLAAGLNAGDITALRLNMQSTGSQLHNLLIRIKSSSLDSLSTDQYETSGFTDVFNNNFSFISFGWNSIYFTTPFTWDGISNLVIEVSYDNVSSGTSTSAYAENTGWQSGLFSSDHDRSLFFQGADYVSVPPQTFAAIDSSITIAFWQYGNPTFQPQTQCSFEGVDSAGNRVLNAHVPWSDGSVYWDAGNIGGSYDRISKAANASDYEGKWSYWTFTKNAATGKMNIYLNGHLWHTGSAMTKLMKNISKFKIGSAANGTWNYDGNIDEFTVWNKELDTTTIQQWMYKDIDNTHPFYSNLQVYFKCNDNSFTTVADSSGNNRDGAVFGPPVFTNIPGKDLFRNFSATAVRPNIVLEQGTYLSHIDTTVTIDSVQMQPMQIVFYNDSLHPLVASDTMTVWPTYYNQYVYNNTGIATDSVYVTPDSTIYLKYYPYYSAPFEVVNRFELARYITPYGNGLSLGNGFTWTFDVSDYRMLLHDSVHLSAGNWQELLDMSFDFIKGTPPRDPIGIQNLWNGGFNYGYSTDPIESHLTPKTVLIPANVSNVRLKSRVTGHGMDSPEDCAEFCPKYHYYKVNGVQKFQKLVWREDCALNPVYPQGGTWVYSRSNWCPGADVKTYDMELTPFITPGDSVTLDHDVQPYTHTSGWSYYQIEDQLVTYSAPNFSNDAAITEIRSPNNANIYKRENPICNNPVIVLKNTGSDTLKSADITFGIEGAVPSTFHWTGNIPFTDTVSIKLGQFDWNGTNNIFYATVSNPNNAADQYPYNNTMRTSYTYTPEYQSALVFEFRANNNPWENEYSLKDDLGNVIFSHNSFTANTTYRDTVNLSNGCYFFRLTDSGGDGLSFWANTGQGTGYMRIKKASGAIIKSFNADFGAEIFQSFTVGYNLPVEDANQEYFVNIFPNPSQGIYTVDLSLPETQNAICSVFDMMGQKVYEKALNNISSASIHIDLSANPTGMYVVNIKTDKKVITKKVMLLK